MNPDSEMNLMKRAGWKHPALLSVLVPGRSRGEGAHPHPGAGDRMQHGVTYPGLPLPMGFVILPSDQGVILLTQEDSYSLPSQRSFFLQVNSHSAYPSRIEIASPTYPNLSSVYTAPGVRENGLLTARLLSLSSGFSATTEGLTANL